MRKIKTILGIVFSLAIVTTMNTTVFAANDSGIPERRGVYIRECVGYEPNYTNIDYTHKLLGSVSGDNTQGSSPMQITYQYEQSGTTTASIAGYANGTTEANVVFAKMQAEVGVEVTGSRSWTKGTSAGVSYSIAPGKFEVLNVYIPGSSATLFVLDENGVGQVVLASGYSATYCKEDGLQLDKNVISISLNLEISSTNSEIHDFNITVTQEENQGKVNTVYSSQENIRSKVANPAEPVNGK